MLYLGSGFCVEIYRGARRRDEVADDDVRDYYWHFALLGCLAECSFGSVVASIAAAVECKCYNAVVE